MGVALAVSTVSITHFMRTVKKRTTRMLPPGQYEVNKLQVLYVGAVPKFDEKTWDQVYGLVKTPFSLNYEKFRKLPSAVSVSDFHCVTGWSKLGNRWEGVVFKTIMDKAGVLGDAKFATVECEHSYTTSLPLEDLSRDNVLLAYRLDGDEIPPEHGGPLRLVVPHKYAYKSAKWVRRIKFTERQELGYWEIQGYSNTADPFADDRYV